MNDVPSTDCIVLLQIYRRTKEPYEKEDSKKKRSLPRKLGDFLSMILPPGENRLEPLDYDMLIEILDADDPLLISCCMDMLFDMSAITAQWRNGRRVLRIKSEAFPTVEKMYDDLRRYVVLG